MALPLVLNMVIASSAARSFSDSAQSVGDGQRRHEQVHVDAGQPLGFLAAESAFSRPGGGGLLPGVPGVLHSG